MPRIPTAVLVDGYNLLHAIPRFAPRGAELAPARAQLEEWLGQAARAAAVSECLLVWDGRAGSRANPTTAPLTVIFTPTGVTADDRLLALCRGSYAARAATTWIISSDHGVQTPARQLGFTVLGAKTFYDRWATARPRGGCAPERHATATKPRPSRADTEAWLNEMARRS
ncbi:MAG: NYN domain-containing protein [Gemmatimonadota bacterium]